MERALRNAYLSQSGWLESADAKLDLRGGQPVPWFTYAAIAFLEREIPADAALYEFGGGQSTLYWANRIRNVVSVDHDPEFEHLVKAPLPAHARFDVIAENSPLPAALEPFAAAAPGLVDPARDERTYRSGQLNQLFRHYALSILAHEANTFDVVVVDGMARTLSTWAAIQHFRKNGFIVFDNSDRDFYAPAFQMLQDAGYRRLDFWGMGPINPYEWCTSVFYEVRSFTSVKWFPR